jgi:pyruvate/2-oxoglutarate dehydrogenase complex dihydrolipoamide acyltransferase (E2) component
VESQRYRYMGSHADMLNSGRPIEPGEFVELTEEELKEPHNAMLLEDDKLMLVDKEAEPNATEAAKELAAENDINLTGVTGSGSGGQILVTDVERTIKEGEEG